MKNSQKIDIPGNRNMILAIMRKAGIK